MKALIRLGSLALLGMAVASGIAAWEARADVVPAIGLWLLAAVATVSAGVGIWGVSGG